MTPRILALDTSTEQLVLALIAAGETFVDEREGGAKASSQLLSAVDALFVRAGHAVADLDAVAFARGPGAFTGLRTATSVAQGLSLALGCPTLAIDSLQIVAEAGRDEARRQWSARVALDAAWPRRVLVLMDARMTQIYAAAYAWDGGATGHALEPSALVSPDEVKRWLAPEVGIELVVGSALTAYGADLALPASLVTQPGDTGRGDALAKLAMLAWHQGPHLDAADTVPIYVRDKVALTEAERGVQMTEKP